MDTPETIAAHDFKANQKPRVLKAKAKRKPRVFEMVGKSTVFV